MLAQHVGVPTQPAPARDDLLVWLAGGNQLLQLRGQGLEAAGSGRGQQSPPLANLDGAGRILKPARQRRRIV